MLKPEPTANEEERLASLQSYRILDTANDLVLDDLTNIAAELCDVPIALVSLVDDHRQWFKSAHGLDAKQTEKNIAFCAHAIHHKDIFEVPNALEDERFFDNPLVTGEPNIRFYAGMPLITEDGFALGTLCVIDRKPRTLDTRQRRFLRSLAREVVTRMELEKKNRQLEKAQRLQELITETNQDYIFVKDQDCRIVEANSAFKTLYPASMQDKIIGYTTVEDYREEEAEAFLADDRKAFAEGRVEKLEKILFPDGRTRTLFTTKVRFEDEIGDAYLLGIARDVTEREELIASLQKSNADLDDFAYMASHDLRAPLTAVRRLLDFVREDGAGQLNDDVFSHLDMIDDRVGRMDRLLTDLLNYAKLGKDEHSAERLSLKEVVSNCEQLVDLPSAFTLTSDDIELCLPRVPLEIVLTNLISNAAKHHDSTNGKITVTAVVKGRDYFIAVSDDGPGIPDAQRLKIFEKFQQLKSQDSEKGSGLGLSMVEKMLSFYDATISVSANTPRGSVFSIRWHIMEVQ